MKKYLISGKDGDHLPVMGEDGKPDHHLMGAAWAALHGGYRGNKYEGPGKDEAIAELKKLYASEKMPVPTAEAIFDGVDLIAEVATLEGAPEDDGWTWPARFIKAGLSKNMDPSTKLRRCYTPEFLQQNAATFEGAPSYMGHQADGPMGLVGKAKDVRYQGGSIVGKIQLLKTQEALRAQLAAAQEAGIAVPLSVRWFIAWDRGTQEGQPVALPKKLFTDLPRSVDFVKDAGAGGEILATAASAESEALLDAVRKVYVNPAPTEEQNKEQQMEEKKEVVTAPVGATKEQLDAHASQMKATAEQVETSRKATEEAARKIEQAEFKTLLSETIESSKLAKPLAKLVRDRYISADGKITVATAEEITAQCTAIRDAFAASVPGPHKRGGGVAVELGMDTQEKMQVGLDRLIGVTHEYTKVKEGGLVFHRKGKKIDAAVPSFEGIAEAYVRYTGDSEIRWFKDGATQEDWDSATFVNALANTLYRRIIQDYAEVDYGLDMLVPNRQPHRVPLKDFRTNDIIRVGYLGDLPLVDPEQVDWPEIAKPSDEQATLQAVQFGGLVSVTRKTIINDDIGLVVKVASRLARAAHRTLARRVFNFLVNNPNIYDGTALFTAGGGSHLNLLTAALAATEFDTIRTAMLKQTEKDSGELLGILPYLLFVPPAKLGAAIQENNRPWLDANFTPNPAQYMFGVPANQGAAESEMVVIGGQPERIKVCELLTHAKHFFVFADPDKVQTFQIGYLQGRTEPELLVADNQLVGKAFTADRIQYKIRHEYEATVVDFRGAFQDGDN